MGSTVFATVSTPGPPGPTGPAGPPGYSGIWIVQAGAPTSLIGNNGDMYLNNATGIGSGDVYGPKASGAWPASTTNIRGAPGATGPAGYSPTYIVQPSPPTSGQGQNGDMAINSSTSDLYGPKAAGAWGPIVANLKGGTGPQGPPGVGYNPRGAWVSTTTYAQGDQVSYASQLYISLQAGNLNNTPSTSPTFWQPVGSGGSQTPWLSDIDGFGHTLKNAGAIGVGTAPDAGALLQVHAATDENLRIWPGLKSTGILLEAANDARAANVPMEIRALPAIIGLPGPSVPSFVYSGVYDSPALILTESDTQTTATNSRGPLVLVNDNTTVGNLTSILFATFAGGNIYGNAQIAAQFVARGSAYPQTDLLFLTNIAAGPTERVRITAAGNVGIGTTTPICLLSLGSSIAAHKLALYDNGVTFYGLGMDGSNIHYEAGGSGGHQFYTNISTLAMSITPAGNLGIGTAAPVAKLAVIGGVALNSPDNHGFDLYIANSNPTLFLDASTNGSPSITLQGRDAGGTTHPVVLTNSPGGAFSVTGGNGNCGIGTFSPTHRLEVWASATVAQAAGSTVYLQRAGGSSYAGFGISGVIAVNPCLYSPIGSDDWAFGFDSGGAMTERMRITSSGNVGINQSTPGYTLDVAGTIHASSKGNLFGGSTGNATTPAVGDANILLYQASAANWAGIGANVLGDIWFRTGTSGSPDARVVITASGLVAVGKTTAAYQLDVSGDVNCTGSFRVNGAPISGGGGLSTMNVVTGSRAIGTIYQNTTGKPMFVSAVINMNASSTMDGVSDSASSPTTTVAAMTSSSVAGARNIGFWVLPSHYYKVIAAAGSGTSVFWIEYT
jgi:hypothetical protein